MNTVSQNNAVFCLYVYNKYELQILIIETLVVPDYCTNKILFIFMKQLFDSYKIDNSLATDKRLTRKPSAEMVPPPYKVKSYRHHKLYYSTQKFKLTAE